MGWFSNKGASDGTKRSRRAVTVSVSSVHGGHSPDKRKGNAKARAAGKRKPPIEIEKTRGGYRLIDSCDRVHYAREAGERTIRAYIWE